MKRNDGKLECDACHETMTSGVVVGVMVSTVGIKKRQQKMMSAALLCKACSGNPTGRKARPAIHALVGAAVRGVMGTLNHAATDGSEAC